MQKHVKSLRTYIVAALFIMMVSVAVVISGDNKCYSRFEIEKAEHYEEVERFCQPLGCHNGVCKYLDEGACGEPQCLVMVDGVM